MAQFFYRSDEEWNSLAERLKLTPCPHRKAVGSLIRHGFLFGFDEGSPKQKTERVGRIYSSNRNAHRRCGHTALGPDGPPAKRSNGYFRFVCPRCKEMQATVNPRNNLAHCFHCNNNLNNIDLLMTPDFRNAVAILQRWLERHQSRLPNTRTTQEAK